MKSLSVIGLLFVAAIIATVPISPQVTPRGIELSVDQAQAQITYGQARRMERRADRYDRRADRRADRYDRRAGYGVAAGGAYLAASGGPRSLGVVVAPGRSATVIDPATGKAMHDRAERLALVLEAITATDLKDRLPQDGTVHATVPTAVAARGLSARRHSALSV